MYASRHHVFSGVHGHCSETNLITEAYLDLSGIFGIPYQVPNIIVANAIVQVIVYSTGCISQ